MAEPPAAAPAGVAASERDALLATKLYVPGPVPGFVAAAAGEALGEGLARGLILVCAPAGFGKTALLADWVRSGDRRLAWLSLDAADSDPVRFWRHVVAALDRAQPGIGERVAPLLGQPPSSFEGLVTALINELAAQPGEDELLLVLDDYHLVDAQQVHASLAFLLEHLPGDCAWWWPAGPTAAVAQPRSGGQRMRIWSCYAPGSKHVDDQVVLARRPIETDQARSRGMDGKPAAPDSRWANFISGISPDDRPMSHEILAGSHEWPTWCPTQFPSKGLPSYFVPGRSLSVKSWFEYGFMVTACLIGFRRWKRHSSALRSRADAIPRSHPSRAG
jgi:hypothetical protein